MTRPSFDRYMLDIARVAAARSTCPRLRVGAVLTVDRHIIATGYNGSLRGQPHCDDVGCDLVDGRCCRAQHAEANAILQAAKLGVSTDWAVCYCTHMPCLACAKLLAGAGVMAVLYDEPYRPDARVLSLGMAVAQYGVTGEDGTH